jgi:hypothetical protein
MPAFHGILPAAPPRLADRQAGQQGTDNSVQRTSFDFQVNAAWLTAAMTGQILLAWLKLLTLDGDLAKPSPGRCATGFCTPRPGWSAGAAPPPENPGHLAVGRRYHSGMAAYRRAAASALTSLKPSLRPRKENPQASGTSATRPASRATVIPRR